MNNQKHFTIGRLAKELGICTETIRYYHRIRLLAIPTHSPGGTVRVYGETHLQQLHFIKRAQCLGFSLEEIRALTELSNGSHCERIQTFAKRKLADLEEKMAELALMRDSIAVLLGECAQNSCDSPCPIIEALLHDASRNLPHDALRNPTLHYASSSAH
jgi:MerR family mercuric resistance operon transcriptional regulator